MTQAPLPEAFRRRLRALLGEAKAAQVEAAMARPRALGVRRNPLCTGPDPWAALAAAGIEVTPLPWLPEAAVVAAERREVLSRHPAVLDGRLYIQNPASMWPAQVLAPRPGEEVLDLCAAPGSKTLQLWAMMAGRGRLAAVEAVRARFHRLRANLARHGAHQVRTYLRDGTGVGRAVGERFHRVLVDAPCSSEGQFSTLQPRTFAYWSERKIRDMARKQRRLLESGFRALRPGGELVYATCTLAPEENEAVVAWLLQKYPAQVEVLPITGGPPKARPGVLAWGEARYPEALAQARRLLPDGELEGFFLCRLRKTASLM